MMSKKREIALNLLNDLKDQLDYLLVLNDRLGISEGLHKGSIESTEYQRGFYDGETKRMFTQYLGDYQLLFKELVEYISINEKLDLVRNERIIPAVPPEDRETLQEGVEK